MVWDGNGGPTEPSSSANGFMAGLAAMGGSDTKMEILILDNGSVGARMALVYTDSMGARPFTKGNSTSTSEMVLASSSGWMVPNMQGNSREVSSTELASTHGLTRRGIQALGRQTSFLVQECT